MPERKKFYEEVNEAVQAALEPIFKNHPEVDGMAVAVVYAQEIGDPPACIVLGDLNNTSLLCRLGIQTGKLQQVIGSGVSSHFAHAQQVAADIQQGEDEQTADQHGHEEEG